MRVSYYQVLGITPNATDEEIKTAYHNLALKYHPDRYQGGDTAKEMFQNINEAFSVLSDPQKRKEYDASLNNGYDYTPNTSSEEKQEVKPQETEEEIQDSATKIDYKRNQKYFEPTVSMGCGGCLFLAIGAPMFLFGFFGWLSDLSNNSPDGNIGLAVVFISLIFLGIAWWDGYSKHKINKEHFNGKEYPTDEQILDQRVAVIQDAKKRRGAQKFGVDLEEWRQAPGFLFGLPINQGVVETLVAHYEGKKPIYDVVQDYSWALSQKILETTNQEKEKVGNMYETVVLKLMQSSVMEYRIQHSLTEPIINETTFEFSYQDIISAMIEPDGFLRLNFISGEVRYYWIMYGDESENRESLNYLKQRILEYRR